MMSALRHADQIVLAHLMVAEKSNEIPAARELIQAPGLTGCLFTLDAEHCQKNRSQPAASCGDRNGSSLICARKGAVDECLVAIDPAKKHDSWAVANLRVVTSSDDPD